LSEHFAAMMVAVDEKEPN